MRQQLVIVGLGAAESPCNTALKSESLIYRFVLDFLDYHTDDHCP